MRGTRLAHIDRVVLQGMKNQFMEMSSIPAQCVIIKLQHRVIFRLIFILYMKVSSILVISVTIKLHNRVV